MSFLKDLVTLDVVTVTGNFVIKKEAKEESRRSVQRNIIDFDSMFNNLKDGSIETDAEMRILAATRIEIDRDTYHFVSSNLTEADEGLVKMHFDAVTAATEGRSATLARLMPRGLRRGDDASGDNT